MSEKSLMTEINKNVKNIEKTHSKFGTKLPSNANKEKEMTLKELSYEQMIMASLASLVWGEKNVDKDTKVKSLLNKPNIFELVKGFGTNLDNQLSILNDIKNYSETNKEILQSIDNNLSQQIVNSTWALIRHLKENTNKLGDRLNTEKFDALNKGIDELITKLSNNIATNLTQFSNTLFIPKFDELIKAIASNDISSQIQDFELLAQDFVTVADSFNDLKTLNQKLIDLIDSKKLLVSSELGINIGTTEQLDKLIESIKDKETFDIFNIDDLTKAKEIIDSVKNVQLFNLDDLNEAKNIFESIQKIQMTADTENILMGIHKFLDAIENSKFDEVKNKETISKLTAFFTGQKGSVENLLESIGKIKVDLDKDKFETLSKAFEIVNIASQLMEGHDTKINTKFFRDLNTVLIGDNYIKGLIENLEKLNVDIGKNTRQNIQTVDDFITTVSNLGNLGFFKLIKSKLNIKLIRHFLLKDITALIGDVDGFKSIRKDLSKSFESLDYLFDTISKLGELDIKHKSRMRRNLLFIEEFLVNDLKSIIEEQLPELASETKEAFESINSINTVIDSVLKFGELDEDKLDKLSESTFNLELFIKDDLKSLLNYIGNKLFKDNTSEQVLNNIINVNEAIEHINELNEKLPSLMYLAKINLKVLGLYLEGTLIKNVFDILHIISNILNDEDKRFLSSKFDGTLQSIIDINGVLSLINTKQGIKDILSLDEELAYMYWCMNYVKEIANSYRKEYKFDEFKKTIQNINSVVESIKVKKEDTNKIKALISLLSTMYTLGQYASNKTTFDTEKFNEATNAIINNAVPFIEEFKKDGKLDKALQVMITIDDKKLEKFDQVIKFIKKFDELSKIAVLSKLSNLGLKGISEEADYIKTIIEKFASIDEKKIKKAKESLSLFTKLVVISAGILLLGALVMKFVDVANLILFTVTLSAFLATIGFIFKKFNAAFKESMKGVKDASILIVASSAILFFSSLIMNYVSPGNLVLFTITLGAFLAAICFVFNKFEKVFKDTMDGAIDAMKIVGISSLILLLASKIFNPKDFGNALLFSIGLGIFLVSIGLSFKTFNSMDPKKILSVAEDVCMIVAISSLALILGAAVTKLVGLKNLLAFVGSLTVLMVGTLLVYIQISKILDKHKSIYKDALAISALITVSGLVLILASNFGGTLSFIDLLAFIGELATLMLGTIAVYVAMSFIFTKFPLTSIYKDALAVSALILVSGLILILASNYGATISLGNLIAFVLELGALILGVYTVYLIASKIPGAKNTIKFSWEFVTLVAVSGLILLLAVKIAKNLDIMSLAIFTVTLAVFIVAIMGAYTLASLGGKTAMKGAKQFALLIAISAAVLIFGTLAVQKWIDIKSLVIFTVCLGVFILAVVGIYGLASRYIKKAMLTAIAIALLTVICAGTLLFGAKLIQDNPGLLENIIWFGIITLGYIGIMGLIMWGLGKIGLGTLLKGILAIVAIGVITYGMVYIFKEAWKSFKDINWDQLITGFKKAGLVMAAVGAAITIIGGIMYATGGVGALVVAAGAAVMAALEALIWGMAKCIKAAASAIKSLKEIGNVDVKKLMIPFKDFVVEGGKAMSSLNIKQMIKIRACVGSVQEMGKALTIIAKSIQDFANLRMPIYGEGGKITGYLNFNEADFGKAAETIKKVILCLGEAIIDTYNYAKQKGIDDIFDSGWFSKDTPFSRVAKSMKNVGPMLSSIADAIQDWAYLRVPVYNSQTGKQTGYKQLKDTELTNAANNIQSVLITIGAAIIGTYKYTQSDKDLKDIFESSSWFGSSPFAKVTKAMKTMGPMLESIADGIQSWADLKVPVYDSNGKVKGYKQLKDKELTDAGESIQKVLIAIGQALITTVEGHTEIFGGDDMIHNSPAVSAAKAMKIMGETLNLTAKSVASYATGEFPIFDKNGKIIKTLTIKDKDYTKAEEGIEKILTCIGRSILNIFKNPKNKELFQGTSSNSPALMAAKSVNEMSKALNASIAAIKQLSELKLDDLHKALNPNCKTRDNIYWRIKDLLNFTIDIYKLFAKPNGEEYGEGGGFLGFGTHDQNFAEFLNEHNPEIKEAGNSITDFTNLLSTIITNFAKMGKMFDKSLKDIAVFGIIVPYVSITMTSINNIIKLLTSDNLINLFKSINDKQNLIIKGENSTFAALNTMLVHMVATKSLFESLGGFDLNKMIAIIQSFNNCVLELQKIGKPNENEQISFGLKFTTNSDELIKEINSYMRVIKLYVAISEYAKNVGEEGYNVLRDGILKVYAATQQIEDNGIFKQHVKQLEDYVEAINSIKLNHLGGLKGLVDSMNELSQRLGNLDNLTDAIGNKLSQVLYELVLQLRKAEATIHNAHELQEKRKKLMDESIEKIHSIMDHHMIVEISQQKEEDTSSTPPGKIGGNPIDDKSPQGTDPTPPTSTASKSNPEETTAAQGTGKSRVSNQPDAAQLKDVLTFGKFKDYMEKQYLNKIRNSG